MTIIRKKQNRDRRYFIDLAKRTSKMLTLPIALTQEERDEINYHRLKGNHYE